MLTPLFRLFFVAPLLASSTEQVIFVEMLPHSGIDYRNVSGSLEKRYILSSVGSGAALFDYDEDGDLDLYVVNGARLEGKTQIPVGPNRLYRNEGNWAFRDVTSKARVGHEGWGVGAAVGDFDNDGLPDLYVTNLGENVLFRNQGDGTFSDVTHSAGVGHEGWGTSAAFFDADGDGDLDLYVANYIDPDLDKIPPPGTGPTCQWLGLPVMCGPKGLTGQSDVYYRNEGAGTFVEASREAGLFDPTAAYGLGVVTGDYDGDGDTDLYVANDTMPNFLFRNQGNGEFVEVGFLSGAAYNAEGQTEAGMGVDLGDVNADGRLDLFVTNFSHETNTLYLNQGEGLLVDATSDLNLHMPSLSLLGWATRFVDLDNDGDLDLFVANGHVYPEIAATNPQNGYRQRNQVFWNLGDGRFAEAELAPEDAMQEITASRGAAFGDLDNDGDTDVVIVNIDAQLSLLRNEAARGGSWITLRLIGTESARDAIGARLTLSAGTSRQVKEVHPSGSILSSNDFRVHFGLGRHKRVDEIHIRWPSGRVQKLQNVEVGQFLTIVEGASP